MKLDFCDCLMLLLVYLKGTGKIEISWIQAFLPTIIQMFAHVINYLYNKDNELSGKTGE